MSVLATSSVPPKRGRHDVPQALLLNAESRMTRGMILSIGKLAAAVPCSPWSIASGRGTTLRGTTASLAAAARWSARVGAKKEGKTR